MDPRRTRRLAGIALLALAAGLVLSGSSRAQAVPLVGFTPEGWSWWQGEPGFLLLPDDARPGAQARFFIVVSGDRADDWLPAWMGGGEITWQGPIQIGGLEWNVRVARGNGYHGLVGVMIGGANQGEIWTFAAVSPESMWAGQDAQVYNSILKGGLP